jgi:capsular exopolysaccharide synthesis family protein
MLPCVTGRPAFVDIRDYLRVLRKHWALIALCVLISLLAGAGATLATTKQYRASAQIFVAIDSASDTSQLAQGNTFTQARVQSYTSLVAAPAVMQPVIDKLGLNLTADGLAGKVSADAPINKVLINIRATDPSAELAAKIANAVADQFSAIVSGLDRTHSNIAIVKLSVTHPAAIPGAPVTPRTKLNLALALLLGLGLGIGIAVLRETLDNTVKSPDVLNAVSEAPVMGIIPLDKKIVKNPIAFRADPHGLRAESFRQLRTNLQFVDVDSPPKIIAVTSALPGEGKSSTALNLAASLSEAGHKVCLIEADLRRPTLAKTMGVLGTVGLTSVLIGQVSIEDALQSIGANLVVMTSGPIPPNPTELLASSQAKEVIQTISKNVDYTIIDTAPLLPVADAAEVAAIAEATLLVVRAGKTTRDQVARARQSLAKVDEKPVGAVLSMAKLKGSTDYGYYYYSYRPERRNRAARANARRPSPVES